MSSGNIALTHEQAEVLREALLQFDQANKSNNVFDLSKPPQVPYNRAGKDFPKLVYGHEGEVKGHVVQVQSEVEEQEHLAKGYSTEPHPEHDYSRIDRNSMVAAAHDAPREEVTADQVEAAKALLEKLVAEEKKKNRRS